MGVWLPDSRLKNTLKARANWYGQLDPSAGSWTLGGKTKAPQTQVWVWGRPSNSPPPELLNCSLDLFLMAVNGSVVPANQHHRATSASEQDQNCGSSSYWRLWTKRGANGEGFVVPEALHLPASCM